MYRFLFKEHTSTQAQTYPKLIFSYSWFSTQPPHEKLFLISFPLDCSIYDIWYTSTLIYKGYREHFLKIMDVL